MRIRAAMVLFALIFSGCVEVPDASSTDASGPQAETESQTTNPAILRDSTIPAPTDTPEPVPVVRLTNTYRRTLPNGSEWKPSMDGQPHGCVDAFVLDETSRRVYVNHYEQTDYQQYNESQMADAVLALSTPTRHPEAYLKNNLLALPTVLPHDVNFTFGNVAPFNRTLVVEAGAASMDGTTIGPGENATLRFDYDWRRSDGVVMRVEETVRVEYLGDWQSPFRVREEHICI